MTAPFPPPAAALDLIDAEFARIDSLLTLAEAMRTGAALPDDFAVHFDVRAAAAEAARRSGAWAGLLAVAPKAGLEGMTALDLDLLALALAPVARPSFGVRIQSLQPHNPQVWPGLALLEEVLMLDSAGAVGAMVARLSPAAPLVALGLLRVEGATPHQTIRPSPRIIPALLAREAELSPPPGASLSAKRGAWEDLILPAPTLRSLRDFTAWVAGAAQIEAWGGRRLHGPLALFSGASGTGKTFAAGVIAEALAERTGQPWALYSLDLGRVMSKYVGETEANLNALLAALEGRRAILQIDEADGLLGKRGEISDARDRYANLEVSHLLSRIEEHQGPVILTTNLRSNVDTAFLRRFQLIVDFPVPEAGARAALWRRLLPPRAPVDPGLDLDALGAAVALSGGQIRNAAAYASVLAAEAEGPVGPAEVARAVWAELSKDARQVRPGEMGFLAGHLEGAA
jgi:ATPase family associated with various cellular activities (AAA)